MRTSLGRLPHHRVRCRRPGLPPRPFDPDRFLPDREAALAPGSYVPHGDGARGGHRCPGEDVVTVAVKLYLTLLLRGATWDLPEQDLELSNELFPLPTSGLRSRSTRSPRGHRRRRMPGNVAAG